MVSRENVFFLKINHMILIWLDGSPQWKRPRGPRDCVIAQMVGEEEYAMKVSSLLENKGIRCDILCFEKLAAKVDVMTYIDGDPEALFGVFIFGADSQRSTISLYCNSELQLNLPLTEGVEKLEKYFRSNCKGRANRERLAKFFFEPMICSLEGLTKTDFEYALQYCLRNSSYFQRDQRGEQPISNFLDLGKPTGHVEMRPEVAGCSESSTYSPRSPDSSEMTIDLCSGTD